MAGKHILLTLTPPAEMLQVIGEITIYWSRVTMMVDEGISRLLDIDGEKSYALSGAFLFNGKLEMFRTLGKVHFKSEPAKLRLFDKLLKDILDCYQERNDIEHSLWLSIADAGTFRAKSRKKKDGGKLERIMLDDIKKTSSNIARLVLSMTDFYNAYIPSSPSQRKYQKHLFGLRPIRLATQKIA